MLEGLFTKFCLLGYSHCTSPCRLAFAIQGTYEVVFKIANVSKARICPKTHPSCVQLRQSIRVAMSSVSSTQNGRATIPVQMKILLNYFKDICVTDI